MISNKNNVKEINKVLKRKSPIKLNEIPDQLIVNSQNRNGMSVNVVFEKYINLKKELGLPVGNLDDGSLNIEDKIVYNLIKYILEEIQVNSAITTSIKPGIAIEAQGATADGTPVFVKGQTISFGNGGAVIE